MKKVLSILLLAGLVNSVDAAGPRRNPARRGRAAAAPAAAAPAAAAAAAPAAAAAADQGFFSKAGQFVKEHKVALGVTAAATVVTALAVYNKKAVCQKTVDALAWMKRNKAASISAIAGILVLGAAGYVWYNAEAGKTIWENVKGAGNKVWADVKSIPGATKDLFNSGLEIAKAHPYYTAAGTVGLVAAVAAAYDLSRDNSVIKKAAKTIYNTLTKKEVGVTA